jgi:hypothetical protein
MALKNFKDIINNKAYFINSKDREIFEKGDLQSFFGFSKKDAIEFIIYDANDNQLPQADYGLVRYIPLTTENINDYFLIADGTLFQAFKFPSEYFVDIERLLNEAGYTNGIFKTQITLLNHRVGSNEKFDKLWISEISPSRTEIRLFPLKRKETEGTELFERFNLLVKDGSFREDTINSSFAMVDNISPTKIADHFLKKWGKDWVDKLKTEYNIVNIEQFLQKVQTLFAKAATNEFTNKISDPNDLNFGKPKPSKEKLELSKSQIKNICLDLYIRCLDYYLSKPVFQQSTSFDLDTNPSVDVVKQVKQIEESDKLIDTTAKVGAVITTKKKQQLDSTFKKLLEKELPPPPPPPPPTPPSEKLGIAYQYQVVRMGIPASFAESAFTYTDLNGNEQKIQTDQFGVVGTFCMIENSWKGAFNLYRFIDSGLCVTKETPSDDVIKVDFTPRLTDTDTKVKEIITPDGLPNITINNTPIFTNNEVLTNTNNVNTLQNMITPNDGSNFIRDGRRNFLNNAFASQNEVIE